MSDIPEDIRRQARDAVVQCVSETTDEKTHIIARALLAERERDRWQPIETAPKDGTRILVTTKNAIHSACFDKIDNTWRVLPKKLTSIVPVPGVVTHWQPLPAPPSAKVRHE